MPDTASPTRPQSEPTREGARRPALLVVREETQERPASRVRPSAHGYGRLVGMSPRMRRLYPLCERLAVSDVPVVLGGQTGTGKEVLAESIHEMGSRRAGPFVVFDCTATPKNLLESALFGHERGAFTGASEMRPGVFEEADGGTLLIDELGDLEFDLQAKLLRVLERGEVRRLGANRWIRTNVRIIAATRRNLREEVQAGRFRDDLYYRLNVTSIELPPLRERDGDIELLATHFWTRMQPGEAPIPPTFLRHLAEQPWPGNVRQLQNAVARRIALGDLDEASADPPGPAVTPTDDRSASGDDPMHMILEQDLPLSQARQMLVSEFERRYVERALSKHQGNVAQAAAAAGIARRYFRLLKARCRSAQ